MATLSTQGARWQEIRLPDRPILIEPRAIAELEALAQPLALAAPREWRGEGPLAAAVAALGDLPAALRDDISALVARFAALLGLSEVRIRLEAINTNACRKIHADYTDVRLITTYFGPGTDYVPHGHEPIEANLKRLPAGTIALFKGRLFHDGHPPCFHRSPPVGDTGERRLVLVIDTPLEASRTGEAAFPLPC
ncbi:DUF1826 domain-containing protein [Novosphingobium piscinae]|uniref:DUF1826 domain-containing protein n=1 Tax=Novosphingobium piscinae TaxID=1507448 RepID=UPI0036D2C70F